MVKVTKKLGTKSRAKQRKKRMMVKGIVIVAALLFTAKISWAEPLRIGEWLSNLELKQGVAVSLTDSKLNYLSTIEVVKLKRFPLTFEIGTAGDADSTDWKLAGVISYPVFSMDRFLDWQIARYINCNLGFYVGAGRLQKDLPETELDMGLSATLISFSW